MVNWFRVLKFPFRAWAADGFSNKLEIVFMVCGSLSLGSRLLRRD